MTIQTPFSLSPDPAYLYLTPNLEATMHKCRYTINYRQGLSCILGDVGVGKSTILRTVYNEYAERDDVVTVLVTSPNFATDFALVKALCLDMGLPPRRSMLDQEGELRAFLIDLFAKGKNAVVLVDEAQRLTGKMLEVVRVLLNFETDNAKLVQIILAGQLELRDRLRDPSKKAIRSRIFAPSLLAPLTLDETAGMIEFRCARFGCANPFAPDSVQAIYEASGGVPREALKLCGIAWDMARLNGVESVPLEAVQAAALELMMG